MKKTALITGTSQGIGKAVSILLLEQGYHVFGYSRKNDILHSKFTFIKTDLRQINSLENIKLPKTNHDIVLINNAADIGKISSFEKKSKNEIINELNTNIIAPSLLTNLILKKYIHNNKIIINISSGAAYKAIRSWSTYCASKAALEIFSKVVSAENHNKLKIYSVHPGVVDTNMQKRIRKVSKSDFPLVDTFIDYHKNDLLVDPNEIAKKLLHIIKNNKKLNETVIFLRDLKLP